MKSTYTNSDNIALILRLLTPVNALVCSLCLQTGLRIDDALSIPTDILSVHFTIKEKKTGKKKRCTISPALCAELESISGKYFVFEHRTDERKHRTRQAVYIDIKRACKALRLNTNITPHSLRKHYAVELYKRSGGDLEKVRKSLNHESDIVTIIYALADAVPPVKARRNKAYF